MGLAPYGKEKYAHEAFKVFEQTLDVEDTKFVWKIKPTDSYYWFKERLEGIRFDSIAWGLQNWVENLLIKWTKNSIRKYKISNIAIAGGVSANSLLRKEIERLKSIYNWKTFIPKIEYCTYNAAMISIAANYYIMEKRFDAINVCPNPRLNF